MKKNSVLGCKSSKSKKCPLEMGFKKAFGHAFSPRQGSRVISGFTWLLYGIRCGYFFPHGMLNNSIFHKSNFFIKECFWYLLSTFSIQNFIILAQKLNELQPFEGTNSKKLKFWENGIAALQRLYRVLRISNGLFRMFCMIHKHHLKPWNHIQKIFSVPLLLSLIHIWRCRRM